MTSDRSRTPNESAHDGVPADQSPLSMGRGVTAGNSLPGSKDPSAEPSSAERAKREQATHEAAAASGASDTSLTDPNADVHPSKERETRPGRDTEAGSGETDRHADSR